MFKASKYIRTVIDAEQMLKDFDNVFMVVSIRPYQGKPEQNLAPGATFTLQVMKDNSEVQIDKKTNLPMENNLMEQFQVTIPGQPCPSDIKRGDYVRLGKFMPEVSYFINYSLILRFGEIVKVQPNKPQSGGANAAR